MSSPSTDINKLIQRQHELQQELQKLEITQRELKEKEDAIIRKQQELKTGSELEKNKKEILAHKFYFASVAATDGKLDLPFFIRPSLAWPGFYTICTPYYKVGYRENVFTPEIHTQITSDHMRLLFKPTESGFALYCAKENDLNQIEQYEFCKTLEEVTNQFGMNPYTYTEEDKTFVVVQTSTLLSLKMNIEQYMLTEEYQKEIRRNSHLSVPILLYSNSPPALNQADTKLRAENKLKN